MKKRYERLVVFVHCLRDCEQRESQTPPMPVAKNAQRQLQRCGMLAQLHLEFRAASFEAQANIAAHMMESLEFRLERLEKD